MELENSDRSRKNGNSETDGRRSHCNTQRTAKRGCQKIVRARHSMQLELKKWQKRMNQAKHRESGNETRETIAEGSS